jgi:oligogalacturonide transport system permease protein
MMRIKFRISGTTILLVVIAFVMCYPLIWLITASFKDNAEIFSSLSLLPKNPTFEGYINGFKGIGRMPFSKFFLNSCLLAVPTVLFTILSSVMVAYGFSRFNVPMKAFLQTLMISTMMLPNAIIMIPRYILFMNLGWLNSYRPFYALALFATNPFFAYLLIQFFRGIPTQLDESAFLDGCTKRAILARIIIPLAKAPIVSVGLFQFLWTWNDFLNALIYINSVKLYPVSLGLRLAIDGDATVGWNKVIAMTIMSMLPCVLLFFAFQRSFVEGIAKSGIKG